MTTADTQEKLKEEAKSIRQRLDELIKDKDPKDRAVRMICVYAGMITETLIEYEEPDVVMEQAFHRISDLLKVEPEDGPDGAGLMPYAWQIDHDTELGRQLGRSVAERLPRSMDDLHEIAIALVLNDFPVWEKELNIGADQLLRLLVETVIASLTYEMATQDFCDMLIEDYLSDGQPVDAALMCMAAVAGVYLAEARHAAPLPDGSEHELTNVMARETVRHGVKGQRDWGKLAPSNDLMDHEKLERIYKYMEKMKPDIEEFFVLIGLDDPMGRAVSVAKAVGRMVAVITIEDVGHIHPSVAKSLAKTGLILGMKHKEQAGA